MSVAIKGTTEGLVVTLGEGEWDDVVAALSERLAASATFFVGAEATLRVDERALDAAQLAYIRDLFTTHGGSLRSVVADDSATRAAARALGVSASASRLRFARPPARQEMDTASGRGPATAPRPAPGRGGASRRTRARSGLRADGGAGGPGLSASSRLARHREAGG